MDRKYSISLTNLYCYLVLIWGLLATLTHSDLIIEYGTIIYNLYNISNILLVVIAISQIVYHNGSMPINKTKCLFIVAFLISSYLSYRNSGRDDIFFVAVVVIGACYIEKKQIIMSLFRGIFIGVISVVALSLLGILSNTTQETVRGTNVVVRYFLGFSHANTLAFLVLELGMMYIYLNYNKLKKVNLLFLLALGVICYRVTYSRTTFICYLCMLLLLILIRNFTRFHLENIWFFISNNSIKLLIIAGLLGTFFVAQNYNSGIGIVDLLSDIIGVRIPLLYDALQLYPINLFGQAINLVNSQEYYLFQGMGVVLDNAYIYMLLEFGVIPTVLLMLGYFGSVKVLIQKRDYTMLMFMIIYLIAGFTEKYFSGLSYNFSLLVLMDFLYTRKGQINERN